MAKETKEKWVRKKELPQEVIDFGLRVRELMEEKDMKITELAFRAGLETENTRKYLNARQEPKISIAIRIANGLGVEPGELFKKPSAKFVLNNKTQKS
jgi:transcriptional regulator with XRE-family HTH domain